MIGTLYRSLTLKLCFFYYILGKFYPGVLIKLHDSIRIGFPHVVPDILLNINILQLALFNERTGTTCVANQGATIFRTIVIGQISPFSLYTPVVS